MTELGNGPSGVWIPACVILSFLKMSRATPDHPLFCSIRNGRYNLGKKAWDMMLTTALYSMPRLRMIGYIAPPSYFICSRYLFIYLFSIKLLGTRLIRVTIFQTMNLWIFHRTPLRPSSRCTQQWQANLNLLFAHEFCCMPWRLWDEMPIWEGKLVEKV